MSQGLRVSIVAFIGVLAMILDQQVSVGAVHVVVAHRGTSTSSIPENTALAFKSGAPYADELETDVRWTRDPPGAPDRTMVLNHDATLDRTTNCTGRVKDRYWSYIRDHCRTDIAHQPIMKLADLLSLAAAKHKALVLEIKVANITNWQAKQFYNAVRNTPNVQVAAFPGGTMNSLRKIRALDGADPRHSLRYGYIAYASSPPSVTTVKSVATAVHIEKTVSASQVAAYRVAGLRVFLWIGYNESDYEMMVGKAPTGVIVDDPKRFQAWYRSHL